MKCRAAFTRWVNAFVVALCALASITCDESLPVYRFPDRILSLNITQVEQLSDQIAPPTRQMVHFQIAGENIYDDVFQDSVDVKGTLRVWWKRKPSRFRTIYLTEKNFSNRSLIRNGQLTLLPGHLFTMDAYWNIKTDDSVYLPYADMLYQSVHVCAPNINCGDPEIFVVECSLSVFDRLGFVQAPPSEFQFIKRMCIQCGGPPCVCPPAEQQHNQREIL